jgi:N-acyl-D-aspartate/D-glutamate deacylase
VSDYDLVLRGGTIVDGTGAPSYRADLAIRDGVVVAIGDDLGAGNDEIDASDRLVVPGFVDLHTHYDAQVLWDPLLSPSSDQGVTTVVMGNCGFSIAPVRSGGRDLLLRTLEKVEDMRLATLEAGIEWDFETYGDYLDALAARQPSINVGGYVGHTAVRVYVMGEDAAERPARRDELDAMREIVHGALVDGALGFSTDRAGFILGAYGKPVPSVAADQGEVEALMRVTAEAGRGIVHIAPGDDYRWLYPFQHELGRPVNWSSILAYPPGSTTRTTYTTKLVDHVKGRADGADVWAQVTCRPIQQLVSMLAPAPLSTVPAFGEVFASPVDRRHELYADDGWRARAARELKASSVPLRWDAYLVAETDRHRALVGRSVASIAAERGRPPFDVMCDLALEDGMATRFAITFANDDPGAIAELLTADGCVLGLSDAGAHVSQICDAVLPTDFLAHWVRDRDLMPLEQGVRKLTGELADVVGLDRGRLTVGRPADVNVVDYDTLDPGPVRRVRDMPGDGERLVADAPSGIDVTIVNGQVTRRDGEMLAPSARRAAGSVLRSVPTSR